MIKFEVENKEYELTHVEFYTKGDLKGYIYCMLDYDNGSHETLYRVLDSENGNDYTLVSVNYGWRIGNDEVIEQVENILTEYAKENDLMNKLK